MAGLPARFDRQAELVLTCRGPALVGEQAGKLHGSVWPAVARPDAVLPWSASPEGQKPGNGDRYVITPADMRRLEAGEV